MGNYSKLSAELTQAICGAPPNTPPEEYWATAHLAFHWCACAMPRQALAHKGSGIGTNTRHPLYGRLDTLGTLVHAYEEKHHPMPECDGASMLRFFMEEHGLTQSDLPEIGSQGIVSEVLNGKRELNVRQIRVLAERCHVSPGVFI